MLCKEKWWWWCSKSNLKKNKKKPKKSKWWGACPSERKNDQVKVKIDQGCPANSIKKGKSWKHDERKKRHNDNNPESLETQTPLGPINIIFFHNEEPKSTLHAW